jgi:predicted dehydrogenase
MKRLALIGAGGIGKEWARALMAAHIPVALVIDTDESKALALADMLGAKASTDAALHLDEFDAGIVAVPHAFLAGVSHKLLESKKHVLCEKPGGISSVQVKANDALARTNGVVYMPGFNHRFHPAYLEAKKLFDAGEIGDLMFIRARYGFGGRAGYEKEWRFNKEISGGGELLDQGVHMIDMARWFMGNIEEVKGFAENMFWGADVEDNGFVLLRNAARKVAQIHVSWTNWEWIHSFEIYGTKGYLVIDGLDTRYRGPERLTVGHADPRGGTFPKEEVYTYSDEKKEDSFAREAAVFLQAIEGGAVDIPPATDMIAALEIVEQVYATRQ